MRKSIIPAAVVTLLMAAAGQATAAEVVVTQAGKKFDKKEVEISVGDSVKFQNDDTIAHNVHSRSKGDKFDLGVQKPGTSSSYTFSNAGSFKVRCAIHPKMKVTVKVK